MDRKTVVTNKKARRDYEILETLEAGIALVGSEVKSLRQSNASLNDSYAKIEGSEVFLYNLYIAPYEEASYLNVDSVRVRKLLLHKQQISKLGDKVAQRGCTLVPLQLYFNERGRAKVELGLGKGKKLYDKREDIKRRDTDLQMRRMMRRR